MFYYTKDNKLITSSVEIFDKDLVEISSEEYNQRLHNAVSTREEGLPLTGNDMYEM